MKEKLLSRDLTSEQMQQVATMQLTQASILEYYYQFIVATEAQQKLCEMAYTAALTFATTLLISPTSVVNEVVEHDLVWDRAVSHDEFDEIFPIERILSIGHIIYLDENEENKEIKNMKLICFNCFEKTY